MASAHAVLNLSYTFENGSSGNGIGTAIDSSGNGLNGVASGGTYASNIPSGGGSLSGDFSGDFNFITTADNALLRVQEFTLSLDFNPSSPNSPGGAIPSTLIVKKIQQNGSFIGNYGLEYNPTTRDVTGVISWSAGNGVVLTAADAALLGEWTSVDLVLDRDVSGTDDLFSLYVNGTLVDSLTQDFPTLSYTSGDLVIGAGNFGSGSTSTFRRNFDGLIDNVSLSTTPIPEPREAVWLFPALSAALLFLRRR